MPNFFITGPRVFSMRMSQRATRDRSTARPSSEPALMQQLCTPRLAWLNVDDWFTSPVTSPPIWRKKSNPYADSTFITSAPSKARSDVASGITAPTPKLRTRTPASGNRSLSMSLLGSLPSPPALLLTSSALLLTSAPSSLTSPDSPGDPAAAGNSSWCWPRAGASGRGRMSLVAPVRNGGRSITTVPRSGSSTGISICRARTCSSARTWGMSKAGVTGRPRAWPWRKTSSIGRSRRISAATRIDHVVVLMAELVGIPHRVDQDLRPAEQLDEGVPLVLPGRDDPHVAVRAREHREGASAGPFRLGALAGRDGAVGVQRPRPVGQAGDPGLHDRHLTTPDTPRRAVVADEEHGQHGGEGARRVEREPRRSIAGRLMRPPTRGKGAARGEDDDRRHSGVAGVGDPHDRLPARRRGGRQRRRLVFEHDIGRLEERLERATVGRGGGVDDDAALAGIAGHEGDAAPRRRAMVDERPAVPRRCAAGGLDQPHLGTETGQRRAGVLGELARHLDHGDALEQAVAEERTGPEPGRITCHRAIPVDPLTAGRRSWGGGPAGARGR